MSAWTTPLTWANGAVSAANMNTISTGLTWLKNALDLITGNTAADTGTTTRLQIARTTGTDTVVSGRVSGDASDRVRVMANGDIAWGGGGGTPDTLLQFANGAITFPTRPLSAPGLVRTKTKAGALNDTDIDSAYTGPTSGLIGVDTTNNRLYVKVGTVWRWVALT